MSAPTSSDRGYVCAPTALAAELSLSVAAQELPVEVFAETLAHQVEGKRVHTRVSKGQDASKHTGDEVAHGGVHLVVVVGAVKVDDMTGQPAHSEQTDEHEHSLGQALP